MVELAAVAVIVLCVTLVVLAMTWLYNRSRSLSQPPAHWELREHSDGELVVVTCECPGEESLLIDSAPWASPEFGYKIEEIRAEGREKIAALNSGRIKGI